MQPYQRADEEVRKRAENKSKLIKNGLSVASSFIGGSALASRVLPLLSKFVPAELMRKGLAKINPRLGGVVESAINNGYDLDQVREFMKEKFSPEKKQSQEQEQSIDQTQDQQQAQPQEQAQKPKESRNIIEQYSPELHQFISSQVASGRNPIEAAAIAQNDKKFKPIIDKLSKDHKTPWSSIIESIYGNGQSANPQQQTQSSQQPQQGTGQATQALMQALQAAKQARQRRT